MNDVLFKELELIGVDVSNSILRFSDREDLYVTFLHKFLDDKTFKNLSNELIAKNYEEAFRNAHTLKGLSGNLGLNPIFIPVCELVDVLRNIHGTSNVDINTINILYNHIESSYKELYDIINKAI